MSDAESQAASPLAVDILCVHCGYNLRGLTSDGRCPECGGAISDSIRGELLRFADIAWLTRLRLGAALKLWAIGLAILLSIGGGAIAIATGSPDAVWIITVVTTFVSAALGLWGTWCITAPDPRLSLSEQSVTLRKVIRTCAVAGLAGGAYQYSGVAAVVAVGPLAVAIIVAIAIGTLAGWVATYAELFYFRRFARRVPDTPLEHSTSSLIWVAPIFAGCALALTFVVVTLFSPGLGGPGATTATATPQPGVVASGFFLIFPCVGGVFVLILFLWYVRLLSKYRKVFAETLLEAKAIAAEPAEPIEPASVEHHQES